MRHLLILTMLLIGFLTTAPGDDITLRDGTVYRNAKVVSHDTTTAQILHQDGGVTVAISQLPDDLQKSLGYDPKQAAPVIAQTGEAKDFQDALRKFYLVDGKLAPRGAVTPATLHFKVLEEADATDPTGASIGHGSYVEIYNPNYVPADPPPAPVVVPPPPTDDGTTPTNDAPVVVTPPAAPDLAGPRDTGRKVFLVNYTGSKTELTTLKAARQGVTSTGDTYYFVVAETFTLDDWRNGGSPK